MKISKKALQYYKEIHKFIVESSGGVFFHTKIENSILVWNYFMGHYDKSYSLLQQLLFLNEKHNSIINSQPINLDIAKNIFNASEDEVNNLKLMPNLTKLIQDLIPDQKDFHAVDIANKLYPNSVMYDTEGRLSNRALPTITRTLRKMRGVLEVKDKYLIFWADKKFINNITNE